MQEFDYTNTFNENEFAEISEQLTPDEAAAAMAAIRGVRKERENRKGQNFKDWFDQAFLPILKDFAEITGSKLKIEQDSHLDIITTTSSRSVIPVSEYKNSYSGVLIGKTISL